MSSRPQIRRRMPQAGALLKKSLVNSHVHWPTAWREARKLSEHAPYSKMAENTLFFCLHVNWPLLPRFKLNIPLNSADEIEATRAN